MHDYAKPKYAEKAKLCYRDSFIVYMKTYDIFEDIVEVVETRFDTSNYELEQPLPKGKNKKVTGLMKDKLGGEIMTKFVGLKAKTYSYVIDDGNEDKTAKGIKTCVIKRKLEFKDYLKASQLKNKINHLEKMKLAQIVLRSFEEHIKNNKLTLKTLQRFKSEGHNVFIEEIGKIALSSNYDKRMQSIHLTETYGNRTSRDLLSEKEIIKYKNIIRHAKINNFDDVKK